jgi:uncharacterized protein YndB with AHSA1/START domain
LAGRSSDGTGPTRWMRRLGVVLGVLVVLVIVVPWTVGSFMARGHFAKGTRVIAAPIDEVWGSVSGFDELGTWAPDLAALERVADVGGLPSYEMKAEDAVITFTFTTVRAPHELAVSLLDSGNSYGGHWSYLLTEVPGGTRVEVSEDGWTEPAFFRFALWAYGHDRTIGRYLDALERKHPAP